MKRNEDISELYHVSSLRAGAVVVYCVILCCLCFGCRSSRSISQSSSTERHENFDNTAVVDTLALTGSITESDSAAVSINENSTDTIKIERDDAGRPVLVVWNHNANLLGTFGSSKISDLGFNGFHSSESHESTGTVDNIDQEEEESKTEIDPAMPLEKIIGPILLGLAILYVTYIIIASGIWPQLKQSIFSRRSNK